MRGGTLGVVNEQSSWKISICLQNKKKKDPCNLLFLNPHNRIRSVPSPKPQVWGGSAARMPPRFGSYAGLTDTNFEKPVELIRVFDPLTRGGTDSRTTLAAFNQLRGQWLVLFGVCGTQTLQVSPKSGRGQRSQRAFLAARVMTDRDHRGVFLDRQPCLLLYWIITGPPEVDRPLCSAINCRN